MIIVNNEVSQPICVARQPIYDAGGNVYGYELLFRQNTGAGNSLFNDGDLATQKVIADGFLLAHTGPFHNKSRYFINFTERLLMEDFAHALPPKKTVVEILEMIDPTTDVLEKCRELKRNGYMIAIDDYVGGPRFLPFLDVADIVKVDVLGRSHSEIFAMAEPLLKKNITLLAEKVENAEVMQYTRSLGFALFQGFYFSRPEMISGKKIGSCDTSRMRILAEICKEDVELGRLACIISSDVSLSYRLLRYLNSATFGYSVKIGSIERAATVLGAKNLKKWLLAAVLSDPEQTNKAMEASWISVQRAFFLQILSSKFQVGLSADALFLVGLFSKIDTILDMPLEEILAQLPLSSGVKNAILDKDHPCHRILEFIDSIEAGDWDATEKYAASLDLDVKHVGDAYLEALKHSGELMSDASPSKSDNRNVELF
ncbi:EAL and HDOD domain-containing protein [Fundidesulfovibrio terrae]|uniref:EAL and HDOD domain-containing protein n=1 Tax=Fundidesulfovibrio terrae TaxID=2922866 RepID=UPI001FAFF107|nr:HDOD domain-containing protein [Fundidesulfovibrio terrae]